MKDLWARAGVTFHLTDEEAQKLFAKAEDDVEGKMDIIKKVIQEGRFALDGESYCPGEAIADFNRKYGTNLPEEDFELCW